MVRMFAKTIRNGKVLQTIKYKHEDDSFDIHHFDEYVKDICESIDSPSPIILAKHIRDYIVFSTTTFRSDDFIEKVNFEKLVIEVYR